MTTLEVEREARQVIAGAGNSQLMLIGMPVGTGQLPDQSDFVNSNCSRCSAPVQSTVIKEKILELTKSTKAPALLLCASCLGPIIWDQFGRNQ